MKICTSCGVSKEIASFHRRKNSVVSRCKECVSLYCRVRYQEKKDHIAAINGKWKDNNKEYRLQLHKAYKKRTKGKQAALEAKRRASKMNQTPAWADLKAIEEFYNNCPEGYHVDHIIPLQGKTVRGLHTMENLQYLPASENISKGNRLSGGV